LYQPVNLKYCHASDILYHQVEITILCSVDNLLIIRGHLQSIYAVRRGV